MTWLVPLVGLVGALIVAVANYLVQRWRYRIDRLSAAIDHLCGEINEVADLATSYWLLDAGQNDQRAQARAIEPRLIGKQMRLDQLFNALTVVDPKFSASAAEELLPEFYDKISGGEFLGSHRAPGLTRAKEVQHIAAELNGALRQEVGHRARDWR
ncbi:hypothetical protein [Afifella pfennigii]|uniref:hypothetical protein n=1 Tax=Afifella pfennigii TaxID=209897 RepID=UPI00047EE9B5|nr:hypothetical protein [Afifella pfennigii]